MTAFLPLHTSEEIVYLQPKRRTEPAESTVLVNRQQHPFRGGNMWTVLIDDSPLLAHLSNHADIELLQITQPAMNKLGRTAGRSRRKILHVD
ncbi:hypothetical protein D3C77_399000 [compost metagenome]